MERVFTNAEGEVEKEDRIYFKLKPDRTMKIYKSQGRPFLEVFKKTTEAEKKKKLFEAGSEQSEEFKKQFSDQKVDDAYFDIDGTWWWQDAAPLNQGKVKLETREGRGENMVSIIVIIVCRVFIIVCTCSYSSFVLVHC